MQLDITILGVGINSFNDGFGGLKDSLHNILQTITGILHFFGLA